MDAKLGTVSGFLFDSDGMGPTVESAVDCGSPESIALAADLLATERYLSGAERSFLETVVANDAVHFRRLQEIAINHGRYL